MKNILKLIGASLIGSLIAGGILLFTKSPQLQNNSVSLGTASAGTISYTKTILPIATSTATDFNDLGTSTRPWAHLYGNYATTVTTDVYDELKIGRSSTTTILGDGQVSTFNGDITVTNLTVNGTCTGCAGIIDIQDAYNNSASQAEILTANNKSIIFGLADTATDANFIIDNLGGQGELRLASASTTNAVFTGYGRLGLGTTSPGVGLGVYATTTILGYDAYLYGQLNLPFLAATSTTASSTLPQLKTTSLTATGLTVQGTLELEQLGTTTFAGGLSIAGGGLLSSAGLTLTGGNIEGSNASAKLAILGLATSSPFSILSVVGTSEITGTTTIDSDLLVKRKTNLAGPIADCVETNSAASAYTIDLSVGCRTKIYADATSDFSITFKNAIDAFSQELWFYVDNINFQPSFASSGSAYELQVGSIKASTTPLEFTEGINKVFVKAIATSTTPTLMIDLIEGSLPR